MIKIHKRNIKHQKNFGHREFEHPPHPGMGPRTFRRFAGRPRRPDFMRPGMRKFRIHKEDLETKDDAQDFMEIEALRLQKHRKRLEQALKRMDAVEGLLEQKIKELAKMKEYSPEKMKKLLKKMDREIEKRTLDEEFW